MQQVPWIQALPSAMHRRVRADLYESRHEKGEAVVRVGDPSHSWIYCADGLLKVSATDAGGRMIMYTGVPQGGWIGEGAVIKGEPRRYDIVALRKSRLVHLPSATFRWLMDTSLEFNHFIVAQLNERLSQYISMVEIDRLQEPAARVAKSLAILFNPVLYPQMTAAVPLSQQELGELAGLSRQSINTALKSLQAQGHVTTVYGTVIVQNLAALRDYRESATVNQPS